VGGLFAGFTAFAVSPGTTPPTTYGAASGLAEGVGLAAGVALMVASAVTAYARPGWRVPALVAAIGVGWLANDWVGWSGGPSLARSVAMVVSPLLVVVLAHLTVSYPERRTGGRLTEATLVALYATATLVTVGYALMRDPFFDVDCWSDCSGNAFLVHRDPAVVRVLDRAWPWVVTVAAAFAISVVAVRLGRATRTARTTTGPVLVATVAATTATAVHAWLARARREDPTLHEFRIVYVARASTLLAVAGALWWAAWRARRTTRSLARLVDDLGAMPAPGTLESTLAHSLDDRLSVCYWLPSSRRYVDTAGRPIEPQPARGQTTTTIVRDGEAVALVIHDAALTPRDAIGPAARIAVDNERLRAEVLARLDELRASRARIVAAADATRCQLERDLHDGAQQQLLAASFELRQACAAANHSGNADLVTTLDTAYDEVQQALTELRDLAHGIYPAILAESGLEPAVRSLAATAPVPVELGSIPDGRYPAPVENAAYTVIAATTDDVAPRSAAGLLVQIADQGDVLIVEVTTDDVELSPDVVVDLGDRVGGLGGAVALAGRVLRAEIPCGS
jgi:signal transduction histidine kinase